MYCTDIAYSIWSWYEDCSIQIHADTCNESWYMFCKLIYVLYRYNLFNLELIQGLVLYRYKLGSYMTCSVWIHVGQSGADTWACSVQIQVVHDMFCADTCCTIWSWYMGWYMGLFCTDTSWYMIVLCRYMMLNLELLQGLIQLHVHSNCYKQIHSNWDWYKQIHLNWG